MSYRAAKIGFGFGGLALLVVLSMLPAVGAFNAGPASPVAISFGACTVTYSGPSGTYAEGSPVPAITVTATYGMSYCSGAGIYSVSGPTSSSGSFTCSSCDASTVFPGGVLAPGHYSILVVFLGIPFTISFTVFNFFVAAELPIGAALAVLVPLGALFAFSRAKGITLFRSA